MCQIVPNGTWSKEPVIQSLLKKIIKALFMFDFGVS